MIVQINTDGIDYYEAKDIARLLMEINMIVKQPIKLTIDDINMEREISEQASKMLPLS